jgi:hypothetical protein
LGSETNLLHWAMVCGWAGRGACQFYTLPIAGRSMAYMPARQGAAGARGAQPVRAARTVTGGGADGVLGPTVKVYSLGRTRRRRGRRRAGGAHAVTHSPEKAKRPLCTSPLLPATLHPRLDDVLVRIWHTYGFRARGRLLRSSIATASRATDRGRVHLSTKPIRLPAWTGIPRLFPLDPNPKRRWQPKRSRTSSVLLAAHCIGLGAHMRPDHRRSPERAGTLDVDRPDPRA